MTSDMHDRTAVCWIAGAAFAWGAAAAVVLFAWGDGLMLAPAEWSPIERITIGALGLVEVTLLGALVWLLTRSRTEELKLAAAELPPKRIARRELVGILIYAVTAQVAGAALGSLAGWGPISFHLIGSLHSSENVPPLTLALGWAGYNFLSYVIVPLAWFGRRYSRAELWLTSRRPGKDFLIVAVILALESIVILSIFGASFFVLNPIQLGLGSILSFGFSFVGTVLPTLVIVAALIVPRILVVTGSRVAAIIGGGVAYAALHILDGWTDYSSISTSGLSLALVFLQYFGPGAFKALLTLRTANAWVHAWAYHAVAPHVWADAPMFVRIFGIR